MIGVYRRFRLLIRTAVGFLPDLSDLVGWYLSFISGTELSVQRRLYFVVRDLTYRSSVEGIVVGAFAGRVSEFLHGPWEGVCIVDWGQCQQQDSVTGCIRLFIDRYLQNF